MPLSRTQLGPYEVVSSIGVGGMGEVYKARDPRLNRFVAIKVLPPEQIASVDRRRRFVQEAKTASALNHPNIITVHEIGTAEELEFIVMEFVSGKTLKELIGHRGIPPADALKYAIQIASALAAAHRAGIVHRDLKPANVMVSDSGVVKVLDFGVAKLTETGDDEDFLNTQTMPGETAKGQVYGTVAYMSPEQADGRKVDSRSDIFAFGSLIYEMFTGRRAFSGPSGVSTMGAILHKEPQPVHELSPGTPSGIAPLIGRCLRKDPRERWQHMDDIAVLIEEIKKEWETGVVAPPQLRARGISWLTVAAGCLLGALAAGAIGFWLRAPAVHSPAEPKFTMLTADAGLSAYPGISSDGRLVVFSSDRAGEGNMDIWAQQIGGRAIRLTSDSADETDPAISPDGTRVVFRSEKEGGGIYVMPSLGGDPLLLAQGGRNPHFSPDGKWIAYWVGREGADFLEGSAQSFILPAGGGQPRPVGKDFAAALYPVWSPNGNALLVLGRRKPSVVEEPKADWWMLPVESGEPVQTGARARVASQQLRNLIWQYGMVPLAWLPEDGGKVVFSAAYGDTVNLWALPLSPQTGHGAGNAFRLTMGTGVDTYASVSSAGRMVFASLLLNFDLWAIPVDPELGKVSGDMRRLTKATSFEFFPSLSADGSKMAFVSGNSGMRDLRIWDSASGKEKTLLSSSSILNPHLSGDGQSVAFGDHDGRILRIPTRGGAVETLCEKCGVPTDASKDGNFIVFEPRDIPEDVKRLNTKTSEVTTLAPAAGSLYGGKLSHDGNWVAFAAASRKTSNSQIWIAPVAGGAVADGKEWIAITGNDAAHRSAAWSPGDSVLYFLSDRDGFRCLWARKLESATKKPAGPLIPVQHFHHSLRSLARLRTLDDIAGPAVAGKTVVLSIGELTGNVWVREPGAR